jgi:hypothetical protein
MDIVDRKGITQNECIKQDKVVPAPEFPAKYKSCYTFFLASINSYGTLSHVSV